MRKIAAMLVVLVAVLTMTAFAAAEELPVHRRRQDRSGGHVHRSEERQRDLGIQQRCVDERRAQSRRQSDGELQDDRDRHRGQRAPAAKK